MSDHAPMTRHAAEMAGEWSYDADNHWLVFTESEGASAIIAFDVQPQWGNRLVRDLSRGDEWRGAYKPWDNYLGDKPRPW